MRDARATARAVEGALTGQLAGATLARVAGRQQWTHGKVAGESGESDDSERRPRRAIRDAPGWEGGSGFGVPSTGPDDGRSASDGRVPTAEAALPGLGITRRHLAVFAGAVIAVWILFVFARAVSDAASITAQEAHLRAQNAGLQAQVSARQAELTTIQSPAFIALEGRAYGYGAPDEQVFALRPGAPPPPRITPLGTASSAGAAQTPLDAWLELLFGH